MNTSSFRHGIDGSDSIGICENNSKRPVDALAVKTSMTDSLTNNFKSRDASASKNPLSS